ncbi:hypothetical protein EIP91_008309 [Steccherinum ochraceum]|uniref:Uncharacterized protein n=1 Tax=Steccherinum ochraceum TaxID=92696 RepID=A0A4R0R310_9APHY|nr:hypothetical protein EIP91_008309 [Steccherinum ochraceum]
MGRQRSAMYAQLPDGMRLCRMLECGKVIPPVEEYKFKLCPECRVDVGGRLRAKKRPRSPKNGTSPSKTKATNVSPKATSTTTTSTSTSAHPTKWKHIPSHPAVTFPTYQNISFMMKTFHARLEGFLQAQVTYLSLKLAEVEELEKAASGQSGEVVRLVHVNPTYFTFEGEFSVVADPMGGDMTAKIHAVRRAVGEVMSVNFRQDKIFSTVDETVIGRSTCNFDLRIPLSSTSAPAPSEPAPVSKSQQPQASNSLSPDDLTHSHHLELSAGTVAPPLSATPLEYPEAEQEKKTALRRLAGELIVSMSWDRRHRFFPGLRTVVRFCMVG